MSIWLSSMKLLPNLKVFFIDCNEEDWKMKYIILWPVIEPYQFPDHSNTFCLFGLGLCRLRNKPTQMFPNTVRTQHRWARRFGCNLHFGVATERLYWPWSVVSHHFYVIKAAQVKKNASHMPCFTYRMFHMSLWYI